MLMAPGFRIQRGIVVWGDLTYDLQSWHFHAEVSHNAHMLIGETCPDLGILWGAADPVEGQEIVLEFPGDQKVCVLVRDMSVH